MDLSKLPIIARKRDRTTDPREIFGSLTLRGSVENIWSPQEEALQRWNEQRRADDLVVEMTTGGGKTLVGLLIAQSVVNETAGKVLYVCPTNQLVEQTARRAAECGIPAATYMKRRWADQVVFDSCEGPCVTNYAALFNGRTIFREHSLAAVVLDDAHVAHDAVRSQFTLRFPRDHVAYTLICNLFRSHFARSSQIQQFEDALAGDWSALLFVPLFALREKSDALRRTLLSQGVQDDVETKFAWEHLKDRLSRCVVLISGSEVEISPPILPVQNTPCFRPGVRRIYMTATMPGQTEFLRTFGVSTFVRIAPGGKSGEAQRQFLFLSGTGDAEHRTLAAELIADRKACILVPSGRVADAWCPTAEKYDGAQGDRGIQDFAASTEPRKLVLAGRYDGIDLPGDACRVLVLDGLPTGEFLIDRFLEQTLQSENLRSSRTATRVVQAMGRIFRSNTDHGAVLLCGSELQSWLHDPNHLLYMPRLLQQQVQFGIELKRMHDTGRVTFEGLLDAVLQGRSDWDQLYRQYLDAFDAGPQPDQPEWYAELVLQERSAFALLWDHSFSNAAAEYGRLAGEADERDSRLGSWFHHWEGLSHELAGNAAVAARAYLLAANGRSELGRPPFTGGTVAECDVTVAGVQAAKIAAQIIGAKDRYIQRLREIAVTLDYGADTNPVEQSLKDLGGLLGLDATRPDREVGTGPDVLWRHPDTKTGAALEAKTNKQPTSQYKKRDDIGQFHDHVQWLDANYPTETFSRWLVGPRLRVSSDANPPRDLRIIGLPEFQSLAHRLQELYVYVESTSTGPDIQICVERGLHMFGLEWPTCLSALESALATDLQRDVTGASAS